MVTKNYEVATLVKFEQKLHGLIMERQQKLNVKVICLTKVTNGDIHLLCYRKEDNSYIVWTAYTNCTVESSYNGFYNGFYDATLEQACREMDRRERLN